MFFAPGKIIERERIFSRADNPEIALDARTQSHTRFRRTLGNDRFRQRMFNQEFRDRGGFLRRDHKIDIAHNFPAAPVTSGDIDLEPIGMRR